MRVVFRTDASLEIGTGHVMRCLTLADALRDQGAECEFVCRAHEGHLKEKIQSKGHDVHFLPESSREHASVQTDNEYEKWLGVDQRKDALQTAQILKKQNDWLVVDHYGLSANWESELRGKAERIMVIDDLANRYHDCDVLLDQNLGRKAQEYEKLVGSDTELLTGPEYALLRPEFSEWREYSLERRKQPQLKQILVTLGGVDKDNMTGQVLDTLESVHLPASCKIVVVMGEYAPSLDSVKKQANTFPGQCEVVVNVNNMAELMAKSDLAIGAAGSTSWERCCLGLPTITLTLAENQVRIAHALCKAGVAWLTDIPQLKNMKSQIEQLGKEPEFLRTVSEAASMVTSGQGVIHISRKLWERGV